MGVGVDELLKKDGKVHENHLKISKHKFFFSTLPDV